MSSVQDRADVLTPEEFCRLYPGRERRYELVDGRVVSMAPPGPEHGDIDANLAGLLGPFVRRNRLGKTYLNTGFILRPNLVRAPDEAYVSKERILASPPPDRGYWEVAPDLAVEIVSPEDRRVELERKIRDYLDSGVRMVWIIDPPTRTVSVYQPEREPRVLVGEALLDGEDVVPGFQAPLAELWPAPLKDE